MPYCEHCSTFNEIGIEYCISCGNPVFKDVIDDGDDPDEYISLGKNIGIGLAFFIVIGIASGIGIFISIVASGESTFSFGLIGSVMIIGAGPIIALIIGIVQGKMASESIGGLIAGGVTGAVGYVFLMLIVLGFFVAAIAVKYPSSDDDDDDNGDDEETAGNFGELAAQFAAILLPSAIIGAFAAYITNKYIFRPRIIFRASGWGQPPPPPPRAPPPPPPQPIQVQAQPPYQGPPPQPQPYPQPQQYQGPPQPYPQPQQPPPQQPPQQQRF